MIKLRYSLQCLGWAATVQNTWRITRRNTWELADQGGEIRMELDWFNDWYILSEYGRSPRQMMMMTLDFNDIERYLIMSFGSVYRSTHGLPPIRGAGFSPDSVSPRYWLAATEKNMVTLVDPHGQTRLAVYGNLSTSADIATYYSWMADVRLTDLQASLLSPDGSPSFPGCTVVQPESVLTTQQPLGPQGPVDPAVRARDLDVSIPGYTVTLGFLGWLGCTGTTISERGDTWILSGPREQHYRIQFADGQYELIWCRHDQSESFVMSTHSITDIERYLTVLFGNTPREPWRHIDVADFASRGLAPGFRLEADQPGKIAIVGNNDCQRVVMAAITATDRDTAVGFSRIANTSLDELRTIMSSSDN